MTTRNFRVRNRSCGKRISHKESKKKACVERKVRECFQWKAHGQCSKGDSCSFSRDRLLHGDLRSGQRRRRTIAFSRTKLEDQDWRRGRKSSKKKKVTERRALQTKRARFRAVTKIVKKLVMYILASSPQVRDRMHIWKKLVLQTSWGWADAQHKVKENWCERISCFIEGSLHNWVVCLRILTRESLFNARGRVIERDFFLSRWRWADHHTLSRSVGRRCTCLSS